MIDDEAVVVAPQKTGDELRAEFRTAQLRALTRRRVALWRDTNQPDVGPQPTAAERPVSFQERHTTGEGT